MAADMFMKIGSYQGESSDEKHKNEIEVLSWSWGMTQSGSMHVGSGGGSGKVNAQDLSFTKYVDKASPNLWKACASGEHIKEGTLTIRKAGGKQVEYLSFKFTDVLVSAINTGGSGGEDRLTEHVSLNFAKIESEYKPQKADGSVEAGVKCYVDFKQNKVG